jgi:hypothetical protein
MSVERAFAGVGFVRGHVVVSGGTGTNMQVHASVEAIPIADKEAGPAAVLKPARPAKEVAVASKSKAHSGNWRSLAPLPEARRWCSAVPIHFTAQDLSAVKGLRTSKSKFQIAAGKASLLSRVTRGR